LPPTIDLETLGFDRGAHILVQRALRGLSPGDELEVRGRDEALRLHLGAWCRQHGHRVEFVESESSGQTVAMITRGRVETDRWSGAQRAGGPSPTEVVDTAPATWGLAVRGALVEEGGPDSGFDLDSKAAVWSDLAPRLYAQAAAAQWDPATAVDWTQAGPLQPEIEAAVVQVMTYLVENEQAALAVPARFLGRIHPHYREVVQVLALQVADDARHMEVFARRAGLNGQMPGTSTVGGRASLATLLAEPDFALASFLLSVLGEGTFLNLLSFLEQHGPDGVTRDVTRLARQDETRHVAFAMGHLEFQLGLQAELRDRMRAAVERRYEALRTTSGLSEDVFDSLVILSAGSWEPAAIAAGHDAVARLERDMAEGRERRLIRLGFPSSEASALSSLHTRNFM
jgi:TusA-related sulfurtransferase